MNKSYLLLFDNSNDTAILDLTALCGIKGYSYLNINDIQNNDIKKYLFINGKQLANNKIISIDATKDNHIIFSFKLTKQLLQNININLGTIINGKNKIEIHVQISKQAALINSLYSNSANILDSKLASFMLMRTNPKLTGNIKLVVDTKYNLYLDTFKVNEILNRKNVRHQQIPSDGNYPRDVYNVFHNIPKGILFSLPDGVYDPHKTHQNFNNQFQTIYEYGAETNDDMLYSENMKILAPLWINQELPDFFVIFRINDAYNTETYSNSEIINLNKFNSLLSKGEIIQYYDLRTSSAIGQYLNNYKDLIKNISGTTYLQFVEQEYQNNLSKESNEGFIHQGTNSWYGISVNRGVITRKEETSYFANNILNEGIKAQDDFNMFLINGFERQNILIPNILNLEFMFNDNQAETYSMHRYFGLYLKENDFLQYKYIKKVTGKNNNIDIEKIGYDNKKVNEDNLKNILSNNEYNNRLIFAITSKNEQRIQNINQLNTFLYNNVLNIPNKNIISSKASYINKEEYNGSSFISMKFTEPIHYGEHFRILFKHQYDAKTETYKDIVLEIIATNDKRLKYVQNNIFPYIQSNHQNFTDEQIYSIFFRSDGEIKKEEFGNFINNGWDSSIYHYSDLRKQFPKLENISNYPNINDSLLATTFMLKDFNKNNEADTIPLSDDYDERYFYITKKDEDVKATEVTSNYPYRSSNHIENEALKDYPYIYRLSFYSQDLNDESKQASLSEQLKRIKACIEKFNQDLYVSYIDNNSICLISKYDNTYFQHISHKDYIGDYTDFNTVYNNQSFEDPIRYYTSKFIFNYKPLYYETFLYDEDTKIFGLINFEILKWRYSNIIKFINFDNTKYYYELEKNIIDSELTEDNMLISSYNSYNKFESISNFNIENGYINLKPNINISYLDITNYIVNNIYSPFNINKSLILTENEINLYNNSIKLYSCMPCNISLMGLLGIKDIDSRINYTSKKKISSSFKFSILKGETLDVSEKSQDLKQFVLYKLISGKFNEINISADSCFYIANNKIYYGITNKDSIGESKELSKITATEDSIISLANTKNYSEYSYSISNSKLTELNYFTNRLNISESELSIPITLPINFKWESNGIYYDRNSECNIEYLNSSVFNKNNGYFNEYLPITNNKASQYIINSIYDSIEYNGSLYTFKDLILNNNHSIKNIIHEFLSYNNSIDTAIGYYNKYVNTLEFIYYGIKFSLRMTSSEYVNTIRLNEYNNYEIIMINDYDKSKKNEIIISTIEHLILFVIHSFNINKFKANENIVETTKNANLNNSISYNYELNNGHLEFSKTFGISDKLIIPKDNNEENIQDSSIFVEFDYLNPDSNSENNNSGFYSYFNTILCTDSSIYSVINTDLTQNNIDLVHSVNSNSNSIVSNDSIDLQSLNYDSRFLNKTSYNLYNYSLNKNINNGIEAFKENIDNNKNYEIYIIKESDKTEHINVSNEYNPLEITTSIPENIKYNFGYFNPVFYNVFDFNILDDKNLSELTNMNLLLSNTKVSNINNIDNYYGLKIDSNTKRTQYRKNYFSINRNIFSSNWDNNYYRNYTSENKFQNLNGYIPGVEDKAFFGSKCLVLPKETYINITNWNINSDNIINYSFINNSYQGSNYNTLNNNRDNIEILSLTINISKAILNYFKTEKPTFIDNWNNFGYNNDIAINNYINQTLSKLFSINDKIEFSLYEKDFGTTLNNRILLEEPSDFNKNWNRYNNIVTNFSKVNEDLILTVYLNNIYRNSTFGFYPTIKINRI